MVAPEGIDAALFDTVFFRISAKCIMPVMQGRGSATFTQMSYEHFGRRFVAQAPSWQRIRLMGEVDKLSLGDGGGPYRQAGSDGYAG